MTDNNNEATNQLNTLNTPELNAWTTKVSSFHEAIWRREQERVRTMVRDESASPTVVNGTTLSLIDSEWPAPHGRLRRPLMVSADVGDAELAKFFLECGCAPDQMNSLGVTALFVAAQEGRLDVVRLLLRADANVNAARSMDGATPILLSAQHGNDDCCRLLVACGANVDQPTTNYGSMPIYAAAFNNCITTVVMLIAAGADVNQSTRGSISARTLYLAAWKDLREIGKVLVVAGASLSSKELSNLSVSLRPDRFAAWKSILSGDIAPAERESIRGTIEAERAKQLQIAIEYHWARLRPKLTEICFGLEPLDLPALLTCTIFESLDEHAHLIPMIKLWTLATDVKHYLCADEKLKRR